MCLQNNHYRVSYTLNLRSLPSLLTYLWQRLRILIWLHGERRAYLLCEQLADSLLGRTLALKRYETHVTFCPFLTDGLRSVTVESWGKQLAVWKPVSH